MTMKMTWREHGHAKQARHDAMTSLSPHAGSPAHLLARKRGHWVIENRLHRRKDVTFREDASLIHIGQGSIAMALMRVAAVSLLDWAGVRRVDDRLRAHSQQPTAAVALVSAPLLTGA